MRAWILDKQAKIENMPLRLEEISTPNPSDSEIRIKVYACGICRTDIHIAEGDLPLKKTPLILGHEIVGIVDKVGKKVQSFKPGDRAGVAWLNHACETCKFCLSNKENLCPQATFTGWDADGGYAEYTILDGNFAFHLEKVLSFEELAPLLCPGIAGYRSLKLTETTNGQKLALYGFGPTASYVLQVAKYLGLEVFVITRSQKNRDAAEKLGADWIGTYDDKPPALFDAGIIFPPAGNLVEFALSQLDSNGRLVLAPVYMTPIEIKDYNLIWLERSIKSLAHISREDGREFLKIAGEIKIKTEIETFPFEKLADVLPLVKHGKINGNAVIKIPWSLKEPTRQNIPFLFSSDVEKVKSEARFDGKWVLTINTGLTAEKVTLKYKEFLQVERIFRDIRVLLSSGYSIDGQAKEIFKRGCDEFIQKPFTLREVSKAIREVLRET